MAVSSSRTGEHHADTDVDVGVEVQLRCAHQLHAILRGGGVVEVKCRSRFCGASAGVVVLHRFDTTTGELVDTKTYRDPCRRT